jgi:hypothetical protein
MYEYLKNGDTSTVNENLEKATHKLFGKFKTILSLAQGDFADGNSASLLAIKQQHKNWEDVEKKFVEILVPMFADVVALPSPLRELFTLLLVTVNMPKDIYMANADLDEMRKKAEKLINDESGYAEFKRLTDKGILPSDAARMVQKSDSESMESLIEKARKSINNNN